MACTHFGVNEISMDQCSSAGFQKLFIILKQLCLSLPAAIVLPSFPRISALASAQTSATHQQQQQGTRPSGSGTPVAGTAAHPAGAGGGLGSASGVAGGAGFQDSMQSFVDYMWVLYQTSSTVKWTHKQTLFTFWGAVSRDTIYRSSARIF